MFGDKNGMKNRDARIAIRITGEHYGRTLPNLTLRRVADTGMQVPPCR